MFRNYITTALRNIAHNKLFATINVVGLVIGFAAAILIALFVRDELSYDKFLPGHNQIYRVSMIGHLPGGRILLDATDAEFAAILKTKYPQIKAIARMAAQAVGLRNGLIEANESIFWADPSFFEVLPFPVIAGDLQRALAEPDSIVLSESAAQKYFGNDSALGKTIEIDRQHPMRVTAVIANLPSNTNFKFDVIASGQTSFSPLATFDARPPLGLHINTEVYTYFRLDGKVDTEKLGADFTATINQIMPPTGGRSVSLVISPITAIHLMPAGGDAMKPSGDTATLYAISTIGLLIMFIACVNFVSLTAAGATRRSTEVGVRKSVGAYRTDLIMQVVGETSLYVAVSVLLAAISVKLLLLYFNAFLDRTITFEFWQPTSLLGFAAIVVVVGTAAGIYPAFVLSAFRPAVVLKGGPPQLRIGNTQKVLAAFQFAVLVGLLISTNVVYLQTKYAVGKGMRLDTDQVVVALPPCNEGFKQAVLDLPGVKAAACSLYAPLGSSQGGSYRMNVTPQGGDPLSLDGRVVDFGFFELYGVKPLAGRLFSKNFSTDAVPVGPNLGPGTNPVAFVINETAAHKLGFQSVADAVGQFVDIPTYDKANNITGKTSHEIIGVVPDFLFGSVRDAVTPSVFWINPNQPRTLNIKLSGGQIPETLSALDALWVQQGNVRPMRRAFLQSRVEALYQDIHRDVRMLTAFSLIAMFVACIGLFGLAVLTAQRRTKEIGIRKAMGASRQEILRLMLWQFAKPVLWANLIAWPLTGFVMHHWLGGFAYHVDLDPLVFIDASVAALVIALVTVSGHAVLVARAQPVAALRYE